MNAKQFKQHAEKLKQDNQAILVLQAQYQKDFGRQMPQHLIDLYIKDNNLYQ
jgi:hypothetical protein